MRQHRPRDRRKTVSIETAQPQDGRERNVTTRGAGDPRTGRDVSDCLLERAQPLGTHKIALVKQDHVPVNKLIARRLAIDVAEIVDDHGGPQALLVRQDVIHQRGFSAPEEPGHDRNRQARWCGGL